MTDLFISYSRADAEFVKTFHRALESEGRSTWVDWDIPATTEWYSEIEQAIEAADNAVFVLSPAWAGSSICRKELDHTVQSGKRLIPLQLDELDPANIPDEIAKLNWIDFREQTDFQQSFKTLIDALDTDPERKRIHSWLLVRARRWEDSSEDRGQTLRGRELVEAETWLGTGETEKPQPTPLQTRFVAASRKVVNQRQRLTLASVSVALVVALVLAATAWIQREIAEERRKVAVAGQLAAQSQLVHADDGTTLERKLLLAVESLQTSWTSEGFTAWADAARLLPTKPLVMEHEGQVRRVKFSPDGKQLASATTNSVRLWNASNGELLFETDEGARGDVLFGPEGDWMALPRGEKLSVWDTRTGTRRGGIEIKHHGGIIALAASPDNSLLAVGYHQKLIIVLDVPGNAVVAEFKIDDRFSDLEFSPDSRLLAVGTDTGQAQVWNLQQKTIVETLEHSRPVKKVAFSQDGRWLALGGNCARGSDCLAPVTVWDVESWKQIASHALATDVLGLEFVDNPQRLAAFGDGGEFRSWETDEWRESSSVSPPARRGPSKPTVTLDHTGRWIATAGYQNVAQIWDLKNSAEVARLVHDGNVVSVDFASQDRRLATGTLDGSVRIWQPPTSGANFRFEHDFQHSGQNVTGVDVNAEGSVIVTIGWDRTTRLWNAVNGKQFAQIEHENPPALVNFSPLGDLVVTAEQYYSRQGCEEVMALIVDSKTGQQQARLSHDSTIKAMSISGDGELVATGTERGKVTLWTMSKGKAVLEFNQESRHEVRALAFSPDSELFAAGEGCPGYATCDATVRLWSVADRTLQREFVHADGIRDLAFSPSGAALATSSSDLSLRLWNPASGKELWRTDYDYPLDTLLFPADGKWLLGAGASGPKGTTSGVLRVIDAKTGTQRYAIRHEWPVTALAMSGDGKWLATVTGMSTRTSRDRGFRARVFETETGTEFAQREQPALTDVAFSPDGRWLLTAGWRQSAAMWAWRPQDMITDACKRLNRNFSAGEWATYFKDETYRCTCAGLVVPENLPIPQDKRYLTITFAEAGTEKEDLSGKTPQPTPICN